MSEARKHFRIDLTQDQKRQIEQATGKQAEAIELSVEELDERISPRKALPT